MSGYLRRLVEIANPGRTIHPITRPLYATQDDQAWPVIHEEEVSAAPLSIEKQIQRPAAEHAAEPDSEQPRLEPQRAQADDFLLPRTQTSRELSPRQEVQGVAPTAADDPSGQDVLPLERRMEPLERPTQLPAAPRAPRAFEPAHAENTLQATPIRGSNRMAFAAPRAAPLKQPAVGANASDDIQIHIGRIEVTAVPPPAIRPQTKPAAKSPSLDEYLKRGRS